MTEPLEIPETGDRPGHWEEVRDHVARLAEQYQRDVVPELVAVTKGFPASLCRIAYREGGFDQLGENRVGELNRKQDELDEPEIRWHMVGHLQSNKVRNLLGKCSLLHSVDRSSVIEEFSKRGNEQSPQDVLLQVNVSGEESKGGVSPERAPEVLEEILRTPELSVRGLMTMAPWTDDRDLLNRTFETCRESRGDLAEQFDVELPQLSMGMSNDYPQAIRQGSTLLRLGRVLFGERPS